jgi:hypothetical protein
MKTVRSLAATAAALFLAATTAQAQLTSSATVAMSVTQQAVISITTSTPSISVNNVAGGTVTYFPQFNVTTTWNQPSSATANVSLVGYFASANALTGTSGNIPTSRVVGYIGANTPTPFTGTVGSYSNAVQFFTQTLASAPNSTRTDPMNIGLDYSTGVTPTAGSYTGTLNLVLLIQ